VTNFLCHVEIRVQGPEEAMQQRQTEARLREGREDPAMAEMAMAGGDGDAEPRRIAGGGAQGAKVARNAPCPCGSGKKYKHCHGRV
jgi:preprotein translocase subunit SecA